jgi:hypothetical protein
MQTPRRRRAPSRSARKRADPRRQLQPSQFKVNECWLVVKASEVPIFTEDEGLFDVYVLQDAASMYLFGTVFVPTGSGIASEQEVGVLFQSAWRAKREWPKRLLLPEGIPPIDSFAAVATRNQIPVEVVPKSALAIYINDVQAGFNEHFGGEKGAA